MHRTNALNDAQIQRFQRKLESARDDAFRFLVKAEQERRILDCDDSQDVVDRSLASTSRELLFERSGQKRRLLQMIEDALRRIDNDEFGPCVSCGERIHSKRLEAMPWTDHCLRCQERLEQVEKLKMYPRLPSAAYARVPLMD